MQLTIHALNFLVGSLVVLLGMSDDYYLMGAAVLVAYLGLFFLAEFVWKKLKAARESDAGAVNLDDFIARRFRG